MPLLMKFLPEGILLPCFFYMELEDLNYVTYALIELSISLEGTGAENFKVGRGSKKQTLAALKLNSLISLKHSPILSGVSA